VFFGPGSLRVKGHVESPGPSLSVYFFSHNRSMKSIIMRELFGPVNTNVNWYNGGARRYNKKKGREGEMLKFYRVFLIKYGTKNRSAFMLTQCKCSQFPFKRFFLRQIRVAFVCASVVKTLKLVK